MAIIVSDKLTDNLSGALKRGSRPDLCFYLSGGGMVGLPYHKFNYPSPPGDLTRGDWPRVLAASNISKIGVLQYYKFCDGNANYTINKLASSLDEVLETQPDLPPRIAPRAKNVWEQFVDGLYKLITTNPAILACIATSGVNCALVDLLRRSGLAPDVINNLLTLWEGMSAVEIAREIKTACRALNIPDKDCPAEIIGGFISREVFKDIVKPPQNGGGVKQPPFKTGRKATLSVTVNDTLLGIFQADEMSDGSYAFYNVSLPPIGNVTGSINFGYCSLSLTSSVLTLASAMGQKIGTNKCKFQHGGYTIVVEIITEGGGVKGEPLSNEEMIVIAVLAFLAIVAIILVSR